MRVALVEEPLLMMITVLYYRTGCFGEQAAPLTLKPGEPMVLRVFVDKSIVEVFANDKQAIARRIYPSPDSQGISIFSSGGEATIESIKTWELFPSNPY